MKNYVLFVAALAVFVVGISLGSPQARAGIIEFFFPMLKKQEIDPSQSLVAPFAAQPFGPPVPPNVQAEAKKAMPLPENAVALDKPHRNTLQVAEWLAPVAAAALTFDADDYANDLAENEKFFDAGGRAQYLQFLKDNKIMKVLELKKYVVRSYSKDAPLLLNEGAVGGRYHWLYEVPVMVSYLERGKADYKETNAINQMVVLKLQIGRSAAAKDPSGMVIEHWSGKGVKVDK